MRCEGSFPQLGNKNDTSGGVSSLERKGKGRDAYSYKSSGIYLILMPFHRRVVVVND